MRPPKMLDTFRQLLQRKHYRRTMVLPGRFIGDDRGWNAVPVLQILDSIYEEQRIISDWSGYQTEPYEDLWYLGITQFVYASLQQGSFCCDAQELFETFLMIFQNPVFVPLCYPPKLPELALRHQEKKDIKDGKIAKMILDIDTAPNPANKYKYFCHRLYNCGDTAQLAELLEHYSTTYGLPIDGTILSNDWIRKLLQEKEVGFFWKMLRPFMEKPENRAFYTPMLLNLMLANHALAAFAQELPLDFPICDGKNTTCRELLQAIFPLAQAVLDGYGEIPVQEQNFYDEQLRALCQMARLLNSGECNA